MMLFITMRRFLLETSSMKHYQFAIVSSLLLMTGCASIVSKSSYPVTVSSEPTGATVTIKNKHGVAMHKGETPLTVTLPSGSGYFGPGDYTLDFQLQGYQPQHTVMQAGLNPWYIGNILFGGAIGFLIVDPLTGAMWKLPEQKAVSLSAQTSEAVITPTALKAN